MYEGGGDVYDESESNVELISTIVKVIILMGAISSIIITGADKESQEILPNIMRLD